MLIEQLGKREETKRKLDIFPPISKFLSNLEAIISKFCPRGGAGRDRRREGVRDKLVSGGFLGRLRKSTFRPPVLCYPH